MAALILSMLRARWGQAVTVWVLAVLATASAVAAPLYVTAIDRAIVASEVAHASGAELSLHLAGTLDRDQHGEVGDDFERLAVDRVKMPGFTSVFGVGFLAMPSDLESAASDQLRRVAFRENLCAHVVVVAGRCLMGGGETVLEAAAAKRFNLTLGDRVSSRAAMYAGTGIVFVPAGRPWSMTVVGLIHPRDPGELYWGTADPNAPDEWQNDPMYVSRTTFDGVDHPSEVQSYDSYAVPGGITLQRLPELRARSDEVPAGWQTSLPDLLDRIDRGRADARRSVPLAAVPVVVLAWAVIVFAVAAGARARRHEFGIVALRGVPKPARWWLAAGETVLAVLAGAPVGMLVGWLVVRAVAPAEPSIEPPAFTYAAVAVLGALLAGLAVQLRTVSAPVAALLREIDRRSARVQSIVLDALVIVLAIVVAVNARSAHAELTGLTALAPALVIAALALLAARALPLLAAPVAERSLRRGRLTAALTALRLARRPAGHRLLVVLVVAIGILAFAGLATAAATESQHRQAESAAGAPTVLSVGPVSREQLLRATRLADPGGRSAMAVVAIPPGDTGLPPSLAVDSGRLAAVALWPAKDSALAGRLRQPAAAALSLTGTQVDLDVTATELAGTTPRLTALVVPADGGERVQLRFGDLALGRHTYRADSPACARGCRLVDVDVDLPMYVGKTVGLTLHRIQQYPFTGWQAPSGASATQTADGLQVALPTSSRRDAGQIRPPDVPDRLGLITTGPLPSDGGYTSFDGSPVPASVVGTVAALPRLGGNGTLVDLADADRAATDSGMTATAEVWLSATAPPSIVDRLSAQGLTVIGRDTVGDERAALARRGSALALQFYLLAGGLAVLLGAAGVVVTAVTDPRGDLWGLRLQGLPAHTVRRVDAWTPASVVVLALPLGLLGGALAWLVVGDTWPAPWRLLWMVAVAGALLVATALISVASASGRRP